MIFALKFFSTWMVSVEWPTLRALIKWGDFMQCKFCKNEAEKGDVYCILCRDKIEQDELDRRIEREERLRATRDNNEE